MSTRSFAVASREYHRLIEQHGHLGTWGWSFSTCKHVWSDGLYDLLGLSSQQITPTYGRFLDCVIADDRDKFETASQVVHDGILRNRLARIVRPGGAVRFIRFIGEVYFDKDGAPIGAAAVIYDTTEQTELEQSHASKRWQQDLLFEQTRGFELHIKPFHPIPAPSRLARITGIPEADLRRDVHLCVPDDERAEWRVQVAEAHERRESYVLSPTLVSNTGTPEKFHVTGIPVQPAEGTETEWVLDIRPAHPRIAVLCIAHDGVSDEDIGGHHIRAARALLDWSMTDLAQASGLSLSSIRRFEDAEASLHNPRKRHAAIAALRAAEIRFTKSSEGIVGVSLD